jgi:thioredoxin reductase (NADPH)
MCRYGQARPTTPGQVLRREGDRTSDFIVVLSGAVAVVDHEAGVERELVRFGTGRFVSELNILTGELRFTTAVAREPGAVLEVPVARLQQVIWRLCQICPPTPMPSMTAARNRLPHAWVDLDTDPAARGDDLAASMSQYFD